MKTDRKPATAGRSLTHSLHCAAFIASLLFTISCADSRGASFFDSKKSHSEKTATTAPEERQGRSFAPGTIQFSYDRESNSLSAIICDKQFNVFLSQKVNPVLTSVASLMHRRQKTSRSEEAVFNEPCETVWGLSVESILALNARGATAQREKLNAVWTATQRLAVAQAPSTGLTLAAMALAWVTASSSFHEISAQIEGFHFQEAIKAFQNIDPQQLGWTTASLFLFASSRIASAATMSQRINTVFEVQETFALAKFGQAFSSAFDRATAKYSEEELTKILNVDQSEGSMHDTFMLDFVESLNTEIIARHVDPKTVLVALRTLSSPLAATLQ